MRNNAPYVQNQARRVNNMRLNKGEVQILLALIDSQILGIQKEEVEHYIKEDAYFKVKSIEQVEKLFTKLLIKEKQLNKRSKIT